MPLSKKKDLPIQILSIILLFLVSSCEYEQVTDQSICEQNQIIVSIDEQNSDLSIACGTNAGRIRVIATGIEDGFEFSLNNGAFSGNGEFDQLGAGTYEIVARSLTDGCLSEPITVEVVNENGLSITVAQKIDPDCGSNNGEITLEPTNGVPPISYQIEGESSQDSPVFDNLGPGSYNFVAIDANGCESTISEIKITTGTSLADQIQPIIQSNCAVTGCHSGNQPPNLSTTDGIISNAARIKSRTSAGTMPPAGRTDLTDEEINLIACWVDDGSPNN